LRLYWFSLFAVLAFATSANADCLRYEPASVTLTGEVTVKPFPGNSHEPILKLAEPVCVDGTPKASYDSKSERNVTELQMVFASYPFGAQWHNKRVTVTGKLFHAFTQSHRTKVLIMVKTAREAGS
jgi:hypothetical protein